MPGQWQEDSYLIPLDFHNTEIDLVIFILPEKTFKAFKTVDFPDPLARQNKYNCQIGLFHP